MRIALAAVSSLSVAIFCSPVVAEQLPKSGSISVHSGYWAVGEAVNVAEKTVQGHGNNRGRRNRGSVRAWLWQVGQVPDLPKCG